MSLSKAKLCTCLIERCRNTRSILTTSLCHGGLSTATTRNERRDGLDDIAGIESSSNRFIATRSKQDGAIILNADEHCGAWRIHTGTYHVPEIT